MRKLTNKDIIEFSVPYFPSDELVESLKNTKASKRCRKKIKLLEKEINKLIK